MSITKKASSKGRCIMIFKVILYAAFGGIISCLLAYPYGWLGMILAYVAGSIAFPLIAGLLTYNRPPKLRDEKGPGAYLG